MAFDGITVAALTKELKETICDGRIAKIAQPESDELLLTIKTKEGQRRLSISASASLPLIYLTNDNKPSPMTAPNFCMLLRKHIGNGRIVDVSQPGLERIIQFRIEHLDELGDLRQKTLVIEIMGKHSNIIFCDEKDQIIDSIKHVPAQMSSVREVLPGRPYFIPDTMEKQDPLTAADEDFSRALRGKPMRISKAVYTSFTGISPVVAEEICYLAGIDSQMTASDLTDDMLTHLYRQFQYYMEDVRNGAFTPVIYFDGNTPKEFSALPLTHFQNLEKKEYGSISEVLSTYYATRNTLVRIRQKSADLRHIVQTALERNRKKYELQSRQLKDTENRDLYKVYGELINAYGYQLPEGSKELTALNYYTGEEITIPLDPVKTPQENAQKYFARYNKQKRTYEALTELISETGDEIRYLESVESALDIALYEEDLTQIKEELSQAGYIRRRQQKKKAKILSRPLHYVSSDGYHMYVGKNNLQNEELTFHFASGNDWWFHAKGVPGSHVILKSGGDEVPDRTFEEAGRLAAYYSKNRGSEKAEIDYIEKKHVKKVNGGRPGFVIYHTNYSLVIDSDISGIEEVK
ncbi:Rqc2 family fibronectin-binding protein [Merdimonas faecis]|uniref:Rqc2 homolog RqcH n=1 Tax=Merdimonas faecis TaxID=1653435 RepID=A0A9D2VVN3_9FIRM|nr:NFACT RNA binding domain-containing protein [Merdimonas faecis]HJH48907.1 NFACT family protein [Merdimonas faecis]